MMSCNSDCLNPTFFQLKRNQGCGVEGFKYNLFSNKISWPSQALTSPPFVFAVLFLFSHSLAVVLYGCNRPRTSFHRISIPSCPKRSMSVLTLQPCIQFSYWSFQFLAFESHAFWNASQCFLNFWALHFQQESLGNSALLKLKKEQS